MYASANSIVRTANGALVIGGRFPLMSLQVSWDDGHSWQFYSLESRPGGNGAMVEVAPNVVMCTAPTHDLRLLVLCRPARALTLCSVPTIKIFTAEGSGRPRARRRGCTSASAWSGATSKAVLCAGSRARADGCRLDDCCVCVNGCENQAIHLH